MSPSYRIATTQTGSAPAATLSRRARLAGHLLSHLLPFHLSAFPPSRLPPTGAKAVSSEGGECRILARSWAIIIRSPRAHARPRTMKCLLLHPSSVWTHTRAHVHTGARAHAVAIRLPTVSVERVRSVSISCKNYAPKRYLSCSLLALAGRRPLCPARCPAGHTTKREREREESGQSRVDGLSVASLCVK